MSTDQNAFDEPDRDDLIMLIAKSIHGDLIDFDNLEDYERADLVETAIDVLDGLALAGLAVARLPAARCD